MRSKKLFKRFTWTVGILIIIWMIGDFGYSRYVAGKLAAWEKNIERDDEGVMSGCKEYSSGSGDTAVILLHGINDTPYCWRKMAPELANDFHVRAMRLPGFGETIPAYAASNSNQWIEAVIGEVKELRKNHNRVFMVAHSLGGAVTIQSVLKSQDDKSNESNESNKSELFDGIVLLAPAIQVSDRRSPLLPTRTWHSIAGALMFTKLTHNPFGNDAKDPEERNSANRVPFTPRSIMNETFKLIDANADRVAEFNTPVLIVLSDQDQVNDHQATVEWAEKIASSQKEIFWNNRSGHALQYDLGWEDVTQKIKEFIQP